MCREELASWDNVSYSWCIVKCIFICFHCQVFQFLNAKCESAFLTKRNPRQINWTVLYRRKHKKGQSVSTTTQ